MERKGMNKRMKIFLTIFIVIALVVAVIRIRLIYLASVSNGEMITDYENPKSVLLVLDVQNDTLNTGVYSNTDMLIQNINEAIHYAGEKDMEVIYTQQVFHNPLDNLLVGGLYTKNSRGAELIPELESDNLVSFTKVRSDAFSNTQLNQYLIDHSISTLYIVGADASACVYKTALAGVRRGYQVNIIEDCIFSVNENILTNMLTKYHQNNISTQKLSEFQGQ